MTYNLLLLQHFSMSLTAITIPGASHYATNVFSTHEADENVMLRTFARGRFLIEIGGPSFTRFDTFFGTQRLVS